jgi:hypothetical protein
LAISLASSGDWEGIFFSLIVLLPAFFAARGGEEGDSTVWEIPVTTYPEQLKEMMDAS